MELVFKMIAPDKSGLWKHFECKKTRFKGAQELKGLFTFDVKFKSDGKIPRRRNMIFINQ